MLHGNRLTLDLFYFSLFVPFKPLVPQIFSTLWIFLGFWFTCWIVSSDCLCDSIVHARLLWGAFVLSLISVAL